MTREYRKKTYKRNHLMQLTLVFLIAFIMGYLVASVFDLTNLIIWFEKHKFLATNKPEVITKNQSVPKFEFYTLLAKNSTPRKQVNDQITKENHSILSKATKETIAFNQEINLPRPVFSPATDAVKVTVAKSISVAEKSNYSLQLASFNKSADAEKLKASLILKGFEVKVVSVRQNQLTWYRVMLGPFKSKESAEKAQLKLAQNERIKGILHKDRL